MAKRCSLVPALPRSDLVEAVTQAERFGVPAGLPAVRPQVTSFPGQAAERTADVLYEALRLPVQASTRGV